MVLSTLRRPLIGLKIPKIISIKVDLPTPDFPSTKILEFFFIFRFIFLNISKSFEYLKKYF